MSFQIIERYSIKDQGGYYHLYQHKSVFCQCDMNFSVFLPKVLVNQKIPCIYWLSGLTCTDKNFRSKAGAARCASELGIVLIIPDTSPRGEQVADDERYYLGQGAGFYLNATQSPWDTHYRMYDYISQELPQVIEALELPLNGRCSIMGHSMGGHGALTIAFKNQAKFACVSAFSPVCNTTLSPWGKFALESYLGTDTKYWREYDACSLVEDYQVDLPILIDQGDADDYYPEELLTENLINCCKQQHVKADIRIQEGYDHSFHFISTFIDEHLRWHYKYLTA